MSAKCAKIESMLNAFIDGELTKKDAAFVREHLDGCGECRSMLEGLLDIEKRLTSLPRLRCPGRIEERILMLSIDTENRGGKHKTFKSFFESLHGRTVTVGLAAAVMIVLLVIGRMIRDEESVPQTFTPEQIEQAREQAELGLSYLGTKINKTEKNILEQVLLKDLPETVRKSIRKTVPIFRGGQG